MARGRIGGLSISEIESILQQRRGELSKLRKQRAVLQRDLDKLDRRIESLGGGRARGGGRPRNTQSLTAILEEVLQKGSKPMQVGDIVDKVQAAGYRSSS